MLIFHSGCGDFNTLHNPKLITEMEIKAAVIGLDSPMQVILEAMASATRSILRYEKESNAKLDSAKTTAAKMLSSASTMFQLESNVGTPTVRILAGDVQSPMAGVIGDEEREDDDVIR
jgi:hypothetical protein